jgi:hypothetical protein
MDFNEAQSIRKIVVSIILLIFCIACAFGAGREYESKGTLEHSPGALGLLLVCSLVLGLIVIGILSPTTIWLD